MALAPGKKRLLVNLDADLALFLETYAKLKRRSQSGVVVEMLMEMVETLSPKDALAVSLVMKAKLTHDPNPEIEEWVEQVLDPLTDQ